MPLFQTLLTITTLGITIWFYWKILNKAGFNSWWAFLLIISLVAMIVASITGLSIFLLVPYIVPAVMIWIFAFIPWPSFEVAKKEKRNARTRGSKKKPPYK